MTESNKKQVSQETVIIIAIIALTCGFFGGVVFSAFKAPSVSPKQTANQAKSPPPAISQQQINDIMALEQQVAADANNVMAWTQLGHLYFDTNDVSNAIRAYTKSLELEPNKPNILTDLGVMYRRNNNPEKALETFKKAAQIDGKHEQSRFNLGVVLLYDFKNKPAAIAAWEDLLKVNSNATTPNGQPITKVLEELRKEN